MQIKDERYIRQLPVEGWGEEGQRKLAGARVLVAGAGGLGSPVTTYLAAAGVGSILLCDYQEVEESNLNRQVLYSSSDIGKGKAVTSASRLEALNPDIEVLPLPGRIPDDVPDTVLAGCSLIIDCLDNWPTRLVLNRWSVEKKIPFLHGGIREHWGQYGLFHPPKTACLSCFMENPGEPDSEPIPVYGALAGAVGSLMAVTALKYLTGISPAADGALHLLDAGTMSLETVRLQQRDDCPVCGGMG